MDAARLRAICQAGLNAVVAIDPDGRVTLWSPGAERMFAWTERELLGNPLPVSLEGSSEDFELVREALESTRPLVGHEIVRRAADGSQIITSVSTIPLHDDDGEVIETIAVIEDLTDRRRAQQRLLESEGRFHTSVEDLLDAFGIFTAIRDDAGRIVDFRIAFTKGLASSSDTAEASEVGATLLGFLQDYETDTLFEELCRVVETGAPLLSRPIIHQARLDNGPWQRAFEVRAARFSDGFVAAFEDITERMETEADLERRNTELTIAGELAELLQAVESPDELFGLMASFGARLFHGMSGTLFLLNESGSHLEAMAPWGDDVVDDQVFAPNECWALRRGRRHGSLGDESAPRCPHVSEEMEAFLCVPLVAQGQAIGVFHLVRKDRKDEDGRWSRVTVEPLAVSVAEHIGLALTNLRLLDSLRHRSIRDPLTGLFNRRYLEETLEREIKRSERRGSPLSLLMLDIDDFKVFNDTHGHDPGDSLMRELSGLLQRHTRGGDAACRLGGDEFLLLLPETSFEDALRRAEELRAEAEVFEVAIGGEVVSVTVTVGVAAFPNHAGDMTSLIRAADEAMYEAKRSGGNAVGEAAAPPST